MKALLAGRAEGTVQTATDLRGYTQGCPVALGDKHRLNETPALHSNSPFARPVLRILLLCNTGRRDFGNLRQPIPQGPAQVRHVIKVAHPAVMNPFHHLLGAKPFLAQIDEKRLKLGTGQPKQIAPIRRRGRGNNVIRRSHDVRAGRGSA